MRFRTTTGVASHYTEWTSWTRGVAWKGLASRDILGKGRQDIGTTLVGDKNFGTPLDEPRNGY